MHAKVGRTDHITQLPSKFRAEVKFTSSHRSNNVKLALYFPKSSDILRKRKRPLSVLLPFRYFVLVESFYRYFGTEQEENKKVST